MTDYINKFDKNKITMPLMVKDKQLLKNYNKIWKKSERWMSKDFDSKTAYGDDDGKHIKTKIKTYEDNITTNFYDKKRSKKFPEVPIIILDSVL